MLTHTYDTCTLAHLSLLFPIFYYFIQFLVIFITINYFSSIYLIQASGYHINNDILSLPLITFNN